MTKIQLSFEGRVVSATLADTDAAQDFIAMLPLTITLHDLFGREKFGALPGSVPPAPVCTQTCELGDILCWAAGPDLAVVHRQDGKAVSGAFHVLGRIDAGAEALGAPGPLRVTIEATAREVEQTTTAIGCMASSNGPSFAGMSRA
jgi:hypothetical protein